MGRRAAFAVAGCLAVATGLAAGCVASRSGASSAGPSPEQLALRRDLSREAQAAIDRRDWPAALDALGRLAAAEPRSAEVHHRLGSVWQAQGRPDYAEHAYRKALELDPDYAAALVGLGQVEAQLGRLVGSLEHLDLAIELDPARGEAHLARGQTLEALGRSDEALAAYFRALEFEPTSTAAMLRVATVQLAYGRSEQALARLDQILELTPDDPEARWRRGRAYLALGRPDRAVEDLRKASLRWPDRPDVYYDLALALSATQPPQADAAIQAAEHARQLAPGWAQARELSERLKR